MREMKCVACILFVVIYANFVSAAEEPNIDQAQKRIVRVAMPFHAANKILEEKYGEGVVVLQIAPPKDREGMPMRLRTWKVDEKRYITLFFTETKDNEIVQRIALFALPTGSKQDVVQFNVREVDIDSL